MTWNFSCCGSRTLTCGVHGNSEIGSCKGYQVELMQMIQECTVYTVVLSMLLFSYSGMLYCCFKCGIIVQALYYSN